MRSDKHTAFTLRKEGKSYTEICSTLGVAKSTLSNWFKGVDFSTEIRKHLTAEALEGSRARFVSLNKSRGDSLFALYERGKIEARNELITHIANPLFTASIAAYWGEGDKVSKNQIRITNTDPTMILLFKEFLVKLCKVPESKIRLALFIYPDLDEAECKSFWSKNVGISTFQKTMILPSKQKTRKLTHGICTLVLSNTYLKKKILLWIDQMPKTILE